MTKEEALKLLNDAPADDKPSKINKALTRKQVVKIVTDGIEIMQDGERVSEIFVKRVHQVCQDRQRPDIWLK